MAYQQPPQQPEQYPTMTSAIPPEHPPQYNCNTGAAQPAQFQPPPQQHPVQQFPPSQQSAQQETQPPKKNSKLASTAHSWYKKIESSPLLAKVGVPINKLSNKLGAEAFWPTTLDLEADKAARILRSFCIDGFQAQSSTSGAQPVANAPQPAASTHGPSSSSRFNKALEKIPPEVIRNAKGLAIFTVMRMGLSWSGAGGSGIIIKKLPNGQWSPPSGILIHTIGWGLIAGADIYDCVAVINNDQGMDGFTGVRCTLGGEVSVAVGPLGGGATVDSEVHKRQAAVYTYTKSKGLYVGVQIDGTIIAERTGENERFYNLPGVRHKWILEGGVEVPSGSMVQLWETLQAAEGKSYNASHLPPAYAAPGDHELEKPREETYREYEQTFADHKDRTDQEQKPPLPARPQ